MKPRMNTNEHEKENILSKSILIILLFLILSISLSAEELFLKEKQNVRNYKIDKFIAISPLISPRVCLGIITAKQNNEQYWIEYKYYLHGFYSEGLKTYGVAVTYNYFWSGTRKGYFTQLTAGIDYVYFTGLFPDSDVIDDFAPNLSAGFGYSFQVGKESYLRLSMDIGYKWFLSNIYISYVW